MSHAYAIQPGTNMSGIQLHSEKCMERIPSVFILITFFGVLLGSDVAIHSLVSGTWINLDYLPAYELIGRSLDVVAPVFAVFAVLITKTLAYIHSFRQ